MGELTGKYKPNIRHQIELERAVKWANKKEEDRVNLRQLIKCMEDSPYVNRDAQHQRTVA